jgi:hypothetical protein
MWAPSIWFDRCLPWQLCVQLLRCLLRRAARHLRLVTDQFEAIGEFALSSWFEWCRLHFLLWSKSKNRWFRRGSGHGAAVRVEFRTPHRRAISRDVVTRPFLDQRPRIEDTPSRGKVYKEPLCFYEIEPVVLGIIQELCFFVLKTYFFSVIQKYVF